MAATTELTTNDIQAVTAAVTQYQQDCATLLGQLEARISSIVGSSFIGDAEKGYFTDTDSFFRNIKPSLEQVNSLADGLKQLLTQIQQGLLDNPDGADPQIGSQNKSAGTETPAVTE